MSAIPSPFGDLEYNLVDVGRLLEIHAQLTGDKRGRRFDVDVLNKSGVVLTVACWEAFVEDAAKAAFTFLLEHATTPAAIPGKVLALAAQPLREHQDAREVYRLAGDGWRAVLQEHADRVLAQFLDGFNTPSAANVDKLLENLLGLRGVSQHWSWHRNSQLQVLQRLQALIKLRGTIAHRVATAKYVTKREVREAAELVMFMAVITCNRLRDHLHTHTQLHPWAHLKVQSAE
jgi:hypothetical protein